MYQACTGNFSVLVRYVMTDGAFRKDVTIETEVTENILFPILQTSLLTPPSDCDGYLYIP